MTSPVNKQPGSVPAYSVPEKRQPEKPWYAKVTEWFHNLGELIGRVGFTQIATSKRREAVLRQYQLLTGGTLAPEATKNAQRVIELAKKIFPQKELKHFGLSKEDELQKELEQMDPTDFVTILPKLSVEALETFASSPQMLQLMQLPQQNLQNIFAALNYEQRTALLTNTAFGLLGKLLDADNEDAAIALIKDMPKTDFEANFVYKEGQKTPPKQWSALRKIVYANSQLNAKQKRKFLKHILDNIDNVSDKRTTRDKMFASFEEAEKTIFKGGA